MERTAELAPSFPSPPPYGGFHMYIKYTAWYDPEFPLEAAEGKHAAVDSRLEAFIDELTEDIRQNGLKNPVVVTVKNQRWTFHPGKCRVKALKRLGYTSVPAIVVNYDLPGYQANMIPQHCRAIDKPSTVYQLMGGDCEVFMNHRVLNVKKTNRITHERRKRPKFVHK